MADKMVELFECPHCGRKGFEKKGLVAHISQKHKDMATDEVVQEPEEVAAENPEAIEVESAPVMEHEPKPMVENLRPDAPEVSPEPAEPTAEQKRAAVELVAEKLAPVNAKVEALGLTRVDELGREEPVRGLFNVEALGSDEPEPERWSCPVCQDTFKDGPGLKRHMTRKHKDGATDPEPEATTDVASERPEKPAVPAADLVPNGKGKAGIKMSAVQLFDNFLGELLPPPLTDNERELLSQVDVSITVPDWAFKWAVLLYILGPRLASKFKELKAKFDADVEAENRRLEDEDRRKRQAELAERMRAQAERERAEAERKKPEPKTDPFEQAKVEW